MLLCATSYSISRYVAKRAFVYGVSVAVVGGLIVLFNSFNQLVESSYPGFPFWLMPLVLAFTAVALGILVWGKLRR